jgi:hypothetical protein
MSMFFKYNCRNLSLGFATKASPCKGAGQKWAWKSHFMFSGMQESLKEWTLTLPNELSFWELDSQWTPKSSKGDCRGQNLLNWKITYIIENFLEHKCLKWVHMTHLSTLNTSFGQKKGRESNCQFDSQPLKVGNRPDFLVRRWRARYLWKDLNEGYNFALNFTSIGVLYTKLWASKVAEVLILGILELPLESPRTKWHLDASPVVKNREYYKGEGDGFLEVRVVVNLVNLCLFVVRLCTKSAPTMHWPICCLVCAGTCE